MKNLIFTLVMICFVYGALGAKRIAFLQNPVTHDPQVGLIQALTEKGYTVDVSYTPFDFTALAAYDLIIIGKDLGGISSDTGGSGDFSDYASWNTLKVPVLILNVACIRTKRLKLMDTNGVISNPDGTLIDPALVTNALPIANGDGTYDPVFNGVTIAGAAFPFVKWFYDFMDYYPSDFITYKNTGKVLAVMDDGVGAVVMARWEPGYEAFPGAGIHAGYRSYLYIGANDDAEKSFNYNDYTDAKLKLFLNEAAFLMDPITSVQNLKSDAQLKVYPTPSTHGKFTIEMKDSKSKTANVKIYTVTGMQVYNKTYESTGNISVNSGLTKGMYLLQVNADGNKLSQKIVIE